MSAASECPDCGWLYEGGVCLHCQHQEIVSVLSAISDTLAEMLAFQRQQADRG